MALNYKIFNNLIVQGDRVVVGVSGGADSMCLLDLLAKHKSNVLFDFYAVHINHNIREIEAKRDEDFVKNFCDKNNIKFKCVQINTKEYAKNNGKTIEQAGRELRYDVFNEIMMELNANKLLVAHHKVDQAETVLMHIARGSSLKGAKGMSLTNGQILRPLLNFTKDEIENYNKLNNIPFVKDSSNSDIKYTRNFIRNEILPKLEKVYPNIVNSICLFANKCSIDDDFIESCLPLNLLNINKDNAELFIKTKDLNYALSSRLIRKAFEGLNASVDIEEKHINEVLKLMNMKNGCEIHLPNNLKAFKEYDRVVVVKDFNRNNYKEEKFKVGLINLEFFGKIEIEPLRGKDFEKQYGKHYIDLEKIPPNAVWRTKKEGDVFSKLGAGSKKLVDYFTDKKVPKRIRDRIPVLANENKILVVAEMDISNEVKISEKSTKIARITYYKL